MASMAAGSRTGRIAALRSASHLRPGAARSAGGEVGRRTWRLVVTGCLATALLAGCGGAAATPSPSPSPETHTISGELVLTSASILPLSTGCKGIGGYSDMDRGAPVTVKDEAGTIVATGTLGHGLPDNSNALSKVCRFPFFVTGVPVAAFYSVEVSRRGALTYSLAEMTARGWAVTFTLG